MADYQMEDLVYELNYESARIAKEVADEITAKEPHKPRFVAGSIGPTNRTARFNCALGANLLQPHLEAIASKTEFAISAHPNAGLPNAFGEYDETAEEMADQIEDYLKKDLINIIGERTNVAGSRKFLRLIKEEKFDEALAIARHQVEGGAQIIDVNMDDGLIDGKEAMAGMNMGIVNPAMLEIYDDIPKDLLEHIEDVVLNRRDDATERLLDFAETVKGVKKQDETKILEWRSLPLQERITHALVKGIDEFIIEDVEQARQESEKPI
eukprot:maker-scaffold10587_size2169-snap-gene-0.0 protein:Tk06304 transcript:maker-scaffold10587_size2169-snap-gene-0.0-mRNA-1 annotation:"methionine synthase"